METLPPLPDTAAPDFAEALESWLTQTGWSKARLAETIGIDRKQLARWTSAEKRQRPSGKAAQLYDAFRAGTLIPHLRLEKSKIENRIEALKQISFQAS